MSVRLFVCLSVCLSASSVGVSFLSLSSLLSLSLGIAEVCVLSLFVCLFLFLPVVSSLILCWNHRALQVLLSLSIDFIGTLCLFSDSVPVHRSLSSFLFQSHSLSVLQG